MSAQQKIQTFEFTFLWQMREKRRLLAIIRKPGVRKHEAWRQLLELANRKAQLKREFDSFLKQTTGNA